MSKKDTTKENISILRMGIIDADLLDNGTRHPNLVLLKLAGYFKSKKIPYTFIKRDYKVDLKNIDYFYVSKVFTFTKEPEFLNYIDSGRIFRGGTGYYAEEEDAALFNQLRNEDMIRLEKDPLLPGFNMVHQMPDYTLYDDFIRTEIQKGKNPKRFKDYLYYSIGFLTRGCVRRCPFCVNKNISHVYNYSELTDFVDTDRPMIYLWDDNFLASKNWKELLRELQDTGKPFQFRQGLDIRLLNEEKAEILAKSRYHGDFIFAFDKIEDKDLIKKKLTIWKKHSKKTTKLYLFCGYEVMDDNSLYIDIINLFKRIEVLMTYGCLGYVMRHEDHKNHPLGNIYTQIARWCNQPQFYKKMSFKEFVDRNQYWMKTEHKCMSLRTYEAFLSHFGENKTEIEYYFNLKYTNLVSY